MTQVRLHGQKTNFELADSLIYLSVKNIAENVNNDVEYTLKFNSSEDYLILKAKVISHLQKYKFELNENLDNEQILNYNIDEVRINYSEVFRDGFLGTFLVNRKGELKGSYYISNNNIIGPTKEFYYYITDSLVYADISKFENIAYSFTKADLPEVPFFSSALEPALAIGTAAVAVYLFFNIRSE